MTTTTNEVLPFDTGYVHAFIKAAMKDGGQPDGVIDPQMAYFLDWLEGLDEADAVNRVSVDRRDLFDSVRYAIKDALTTDENMNDEAGLWSDAHDRTVKCLERLYGARGVQPPRVPHDFTTHRDAWRRAIENLVRQDGEGYWAHELRAFDNAFNELLGTAAAVQQDGKNNGQN